MIAWFYLYQWNVRNTTSNFSELKWKWQQRKATERTVWCVTIGGHEKALFPISEDCLQSNMATLFFSTSSFLRKTRALRTVSSLYEKQMSPYILHTIQSHLQLAVRQLFSMHQNTPHTDTFLPRQTAYRREQQHCGPQKPHLRERGSTITTIIIIYERYIWHTGHLAPTERNAQRLMAEVPPLSSLDENYQE